MMMATSARTSCGRLIAQPRTWKPSSTAPASERQGDAQMSQAAAIRARGPLVWLDMDQQQLDDAYDQAVYAPNRDLVHARLAAANVRAPRSWASRCGC